MSVKNLEGTCSFEVGICCNNFTFEETSTSKEILLTKPTIHVARLQAKQKTAVIARNEVTKQSLAPFVIARNEVTKQSVTLLAKD